MSGSVILAETARIERNSPMQKIEPVHFEDLFAARLEQYDSDREMVTAEQQEQNDLISRLRTANSSFISARRGDTSTREREQALQKLENAYTKYQEIIGNLDVGRTFYNNLAKIVNPFRDECREFRYQRRVEANTMEV